MKADNYERAIGLIADIWRGLPTHPSTFAGCSHPLHEQRGHTRPARGGGHCVDCLAFDLFDIVGAPARDFVKAARTAKLFQQKCEEIAEELDRE